MCRRNRAYCAGSTCSPRRSYMIPTTQPLLPPSYQTTGVVGLMDAINGMSLSSQTSPNNEKSATIDPSAKNLMPHSLPLASEKGMIEELPSYDRATQEGSINLPAAQLNPQNDQTTIRSSYLQMFQQAVIAYHSGIQQSRCMKKRAAKNLVRDLYHMVVDQRAAEGVKLGCKERKQIRRELEPVKHAFHNMVN